MNQGKLEVVKQEMARVNIDILGISELRWTEMGEFKSEDHYIYYCGQEFLRRNGVAIMVNNRVQKAVLGCNLKNDRITGSAAKVKNDMKQKGHIFFRIQSFMACLQCAFFLQKE